MSSWHLFTFYLFTFAFVYLFTFAPKVRDLPACSPVPKTVSRTLVGCSKYLLNGWMRWLWQSKLLWMRLTLKKKQKKQTIVACISVSQSRQCLYSFGYYDHDYYFVLEPFSEAKHVGDLRDIKIFQLIVPPANRISLTFYLTHLFLSQL